MRVLIVYESMFGNTRRIADAIAEGLAGHAETDIREVGDTPAKPDPEIDLLVIGGPTHAWGMSRPRTRQGARQQLPGKPVSAGIGVREWLALLLPAVATDPAVATFDTRLDKPRWLTGSAGRDIAKRLRRLGYRVVAEHSFVVTGTPGPLGPDEVERARQWGVHLSGAGAPTRS